MAANLCFVGRNLGRLGAKDMISGLAAYGLQPDQVCLFRLVLLEILSKKDDAL